MTNTNKIIVHLSFSRCLECIASLRVISDIEGVVTLRSVRVVAALHHEGVGLATHHMDLWDEEAVDVPGNPPANVSCGREKRGLMLQTSLADTM